MNPSLTTAAVHGINRKGFMQILFYQVKDYLVGQMAYKMNDPNIIRENSLRKKGN